MKRKATSAAKDAGKDVQRKAEDAGDSARDTAGDLKRDAQKGADRISRTSVESASSCKYVHSVMDFEVLVALTCKIFGCCKNLERTNYLLKSKLKIILRIIELAFFELIMLGLLLVKLPFATVVLYRMHCWSWSFSE